jgi:hypothetical protein
MDGSLHEEIHPVLQPVTINSRPALPAGAQAKSSDACASGRATPSLRRKRQKTFSPWLSRVLTLIAAPHSAEAVDIA